MPADEMPAMLAETVHRKAASRYRAAVRSAMEVPRKRESACQSAHGFDGYRMSIGEVSAGDPILSSLNPILGEPISPKMLFGED